MSADIHRLPGHVYLPSELVNRVRTRAETLGLPLSLYFRLLLRNYSYAGRPASVERPPNGKEARVRLSFSVPPDLWNAAADATERLGWSVSLLVEALALIDVEQGGGLTIWPVDGGEDRSRRPGSRDASSCP